MPSKNTWFLVGVIAIAVGVSAGMFIEPYRPWCAAACMTFWLTTVPRIWRRRQSGWLAVDAGSRRSPMGDVAVLIAGLAVAVSRLLDVEMNNVLAACFMLPAVALLIDRRQRPNAPQKNVVF